MHTVLSDDVVTINGVEVRVPYADEKPLTIEQLDWLDAHDIDVHICRRRRRSFSPYKELLELLNF